MKEIFHLPVLPFEPADMKGLMSEETIHFHYLKHHSGYVDKTNELMSENNKKFSDMSIENIIRVAEGPLFNNASQAWNHTFLWLSLASPKTAKQDIRPIRRPITDSFGGIKECKKDFVTKGKEHFGSGWLWLAHKGDGEKELEWVQMHDAESPLKEGFVPLLACDLWEHAYYLDFQNDREKYLENFFEHLNWSFAEEVLKDGKTPELDDLLRANDTGATTYDSHYVGGIAF